MPCCPGSHAQPLPLKGLDDWWTSTRHGSSTSGRGAYGHLYLGGSAGPTPRVKEITQHSYEIVEALQEQLSPPRSHVRCGAREPGARGTPEVAAALKDLGVEVKGLWLADFDSGDGYYYCWQLGEDDIEHFHRYETGFAGRRPITLLD